MRRNTYQLSNLRDTCRRAQNVGELREILEAVLDHLYSAEVDYHQQKARDLQRR
jgi:hypothetical protein